MEEARIVRHGDKEAFVFTTRSGVRAVIATNLPSELVADLKRKLERKIRRADRRWSRAAFDISGGEPST